MTPFCLSIYLSVCLSVTISRPDEGSRGDTLCGLPAGGGGIDGLELGIPVWWPSPLCLPTAQLCTAPLLMWVGEDGPEQQVASSPANKKMSGPLYTKQTPSRVRGQFRTQQRVCRLWPSYHHTTQTFDTTWARDGFSVRPHKIFVCNTNTRPEGWASCNAHPHRPYMHPVWPEHG